MIDLSDPDSYVDGPPHDYFTELRASDPVHWNENGDGSGGFWAICKHADLEHVARHPFVFSSEVGGVVLEDLAPQQLEQMRGMLLAMDPPRHNTMRKPLTPRLTPRAVDALTGDIRAICAEAFDEAAQRGEVDFVHDVAGRLPTRIIGKMMGLPRADWDRVHALAELTTHGQDEDYLSTAISVDAGSASLEMGAYGYQFAVDRLAADPVDDLTGAILAAVGPVEFAMMFVQLVTAGQDTTQTMLSSGLLAMLQHDGQLSALRADPAGWPLAIEEILRWANPLHYFRRTATEDAEIHGKAINAGDKVAMFYTSANRDEEVFEHSQDFDSTRKPNKHLSFGQAEHFCLGVHLARLEGRLFFADLVTSFATIELTGDPVRLRSNLNNALKSLPVRLAA